MPEAGAPQGLDRIFQGVSAPKKSKGLLKHTAFGCLPISILAGQWDVGVQPWFCTIWGSAEGEGIV